MLLALIAVIGNRKKLCTFNGSPVWRQLLVELLRVLSQWLAPASLDGRRTVGKQFGYALMTPVGQFRSLEEFPCQMVSSKLL